MGLDNVIDFTCFAWTLYQIYKEFFKQKNPVDGGKKRSERKPKSKRQKK
jgi:hypothetical protein